MAWNTKATGAYARLSQEAYDNALTIYSILYSLGWTLEATCGVLGNIESESGYNPWRWQSDVVLPYQDPRIDYQNAHAYGLCQWDPAAKYINGGTAYAGYGPNYSDRPGWINDGSAQLMYLNDYADYYQYPSYPGSYYYIPYAQYKTATISDYSIEFLTKTWFWSFERGTWDDGRTAAAQYWYATFGGVTPPDPPDPDPPRKIPIWLLFKIKEANKL